MKQRIITGVLGLILLGACMLLFNTIFFNIIISIVAVVATFEVLSAMRLIRLKSLCVVCAFLSVVSCFNTFIGKYSTVVYVLILLFAFIVLIANHKNLLFKDALTAVFLSYVIGFSFSTFILVRDMCTENVSLGVFYVLLILGGAWLSDTGAYFVGSLCGKKKLAPNISPKKTVEGAIGGFITCIVCFVVIGLIFQAIWGNTIEVNFLILSLTGAILSVLSILGDLTASVIKRQCGIKDFGKIFPGHGGVLDRFDSVLFTAPALWIIITHINIVI